MPFVRSRRLGGGLAGTVVLGTIALAACTREADIVRVQPASWSGVGESGIVSEFSVIAGRARADDLVLLLIDEPALLQVHPERGTALRHPITGLEQGESPWGLARLADGSLWTMLLPQVVAELRSDGTIGERLAQPPLIGLFGFQNVLVVQKYEAPGGTAALMQGPPQSPTERPFGSLTIRAAERSRLDLAVGNLVACGLSDTRELPCWHADDSTIDRVRPDGAGHQVTLAGGSGTPFGPPAVVEGHRHPIRDVYVDRRGVLWALWTSGTRSSGETNLGWYLSRHGDEGDLIDAVALPAGCRTILKTSRDTAWLLAHTGRIVRLEMP